MEKDILIDFLLSKGISDTHKIRYLLSCLGLSYSQIAKSQNIAHKGSIHWSIQKAKAEINKLSIHDYHIELMKVLFNEDFFYSEEMPPIIPPEE